MVYNSIRDELDGRNSELSKQIDRCVCESHSCKQQHRYWNSTQYSEDSREVNPILGNQHKCESGMSEKIIEIAETE